MNIPKPIYYLTPTIPRFSWDIPNKILKFYTSKLYDKSDRINCIYLDKNKRYEDNILLYYIEKIKSEYEKTFNKPHNLDITIILDNHGAKKNISWNISNYINGIIKKTKNMDRFDNIDISYITISEISRNPYYTFNRRYSDIVISLCCDTDDILFNFLNMSDTKILIITVNKRTFNEMIYNGYNAENSNVWETNYKKDLRVEKLNRIINK